MVESVQNGKIENPSDGVVSGVILGGADFVKWIKQEFLHKDSDFKEKPQLRSL